MPSPAAPAPYFFKNCRVPHPHPHPSLETHPCFIDNNWSLETSQNNIVSLAKRRWEICTPPCLWDPTWKPQRKLPFFVLFNSLLNTSTTNRNKSGNKGSPCRIPWELPKKPAGDPLTKIENLTIEIHALIQLLHLALHVLYALNTQVKFCVNWILITIWSISLYFIHNFKLQKLVI